MSIHMVPFQHCHHVATPSTNPTGRRLSTERIAAEPGSTGFGSTVRVTEDDGICSEAGGPTHDTDVADSESVGGVVVHELTTATSISVRSPRWSEPVLRFQSSFMSRVTPRVRCPPPDEEHYRSFCRSDVSRRLRGHTESALNGAHDVVVEVVVAAIERAFLSDD